MMFKTILSIAMGLILCGCDQLGSPKSPPPDSMANEAQTTQPEESNLSCNSDQQKDSLRKVKNLIFVIGDGMGPQQIGLLYLYAHHPPKSIYKTRRGATTLEEIMNRGEIGISLVEPTDSLVVDSAASATQLASGKMSRPEMIGSTSSGDVAKTILEVAQERGLATGLITNTRMTHATPAAFAAHITHRSLENEIAVELLRGSPVIPFLPSS